MARGRTQPANHPTVQAPARLLAGVRRSLFTAVEMPALHRPSVAERIGPRHPAMGTHQGRVGHLRSLGILGTLLEMEIVQLVLARKPLVAVGTVHPLPLFSLGVLGTIVEMPLQHHAPRTRLVAMGALYPSLGVVFETLPHAIGDHALPLGLGEFLARGGGRLSTSLGRGHPGPAFVRRHSPTVGGPDALFGRFGMRLSRVGKAIAAIVRGGGVALIEKAGMVFYIKVGVEHGFVRLGSLEGVKNSPDFFLKTGCAMLANQRPNGSAAGEIAPILFGRHVTAAHAVIILGPGVRFG